jgi:hypothetical protein
MLVLKLDQKIGFEALRGRQLPDHEAETESAVWFTKTLLHRNIRALCRTRVVVLPNSTFETVLICGTPDVGDLRFTYIASLRAG